MFSIVADRLLLTVQVLTFVGAFLSLVAIFFPISGMTETAYTFTYPDGTVATPLNDPATTGVTAGDVIVGAISAIFMLAMGTAIFLLRKIADRLEKETR